MVTTPRRAGRGLFPWLDRAAWRDIVLLIGLGTATRIVLFLVDPNPLFSTDSSTYLWSSRNLFLPYARPVGTGMLYRGVLWLVDDLRAIVAVQALLGVATTALVYALGREARIRRGPAVMAALVCSMAPSALLFEKTMHAETLAVFLIAATLLAVSVALRSERVAHWSALGVLAVSAFFVRSAALSVLVTVLLALMLWWGQSVRRRLAAALVVVGALALPAAAYGLAMAYQTRDMAGGPYFGVTHFDGASAYALVAGQTDCENPGRPPPIRADLCADPALLQEGPDVILWGDGPVQDAIATQDWPPVNAELRRLAVEAIIRNPLSYVLGSVGRVGGLLMDEDPGGLLTYVPNPADAGLGEFVAATFPGDIVYPPAGTISPYSQALSMWYRLRLVLAIGVIGAALYLTLAPDRQDLTARVLVLYVFVSVALVCLTSYTSPRLAYPVEIPAVLATAWVIDRLQRSLRSGE